MTARIHSKMKWSSVFMVLGIGTMIVLPFVGFKNPVSALGYLLPVIALDVFYKFFGTKKHLWLLTLVGGLSYMVVPIYRILLMSLSGIPYPAAVKYGTVFAPLAGFFVFGLLGSGLALGLSLTIKNMKNENKK